MWSSREQRNRHNLTDKKHLSRTDKNTKGETINAEHEAIGNKAIAFVGTSGVQLGWLASQADMLAEDWRIVE